MSEIESRFKRIAFGYDHKDIIEAITADILDVVPIVGDVSNTIRVRNMAKAQPDTPAARRQLLDAVIGNIPIIGDIFDLLTPTNTINFLDKQIKAVKPEPLKLIDELMSDVDKFIRGS